MSHKSSKDTRKKQKKLLQDKKYISKRREIYNNILKRFEIYDDINKIPLKLKEKIYSYSYPDVEIDINEVKKLNFSNSIKEHIRLLIDEKEMEVLGKTFPLSYLRYIQALITTLRSLNVHLARIDDPTQLEKTILNSLNKANSKLNNEFIGKILISCFEEIAKIVAKVALVYFTPENGVYPTITIEKDSKLKSYIKIKLRKLNIKKTNLRIEGEQRTAFPLVHFQEEKSKKTCFSELAPVVIEPGIIDNDQPLSVYVQDHALNRLFERIKIAPQGYIHDCIGSSLKKPEVVCRNGNSYLIAFNFYSYKLGYLVVSKTNNFALVRSFKFLTMTGTPEFNELSKRLKATKHDITYMGLDSLETFVNSDLFKDKELKLIFEKCGLGSLIKLTEIQDVFKTPSVSIAEEVKQYFKF